MMRRIYSMIALWSLALTSALYAQTLVTSGTYSGNGHLYEVYDAPQITWDDAQAFAVSRGGYLATITDDAENTFVGNLNYSVTPGQRWLGGFQPPNETDRLANWQWVTGEPWGYTNWAPGEPNDAGGRLEQHLTIARYPSYPLKWNDEGYLNQIQGFIVEYVPEPASIMVLGSGLAALAARRRRR